jgi:putative transposon-encoded protein
MVRVVLLVTRVEMIVDVVDVSWERSVTVLGCAGKIVVGYVLFRWVLSWWNQQASAL